ncbi:MAG TPA: pyrophosphatase [Chloroflexota bacterium]|nr:pyrophosphatase [Chloroflexota bacterium]
MLTIREIQEQARELRASKGWPDAPAEERALSLVAEVGEAVQEVLHLVRGRGRLPESEVNEVKGRLGLELYDVVWNVCDLADKLGIDLEQAFAHKAATNRERRW